MSFHAAATDTRSKGKATMRHVALAALLAGAIGSTVAMLPANAQSANASGPSFNCARAASTVEKAICGDAALASLDRRIGTRYATLLVQIAGRAAKELKQDQIWFISGRNRAFADTTTPLAQRRSELGDTLRERLKFLSAITPRPPKNLAGTWKNEIGEIVFSRDGAGVLQFEGSSAGPTQGRWVCDAAGEVRMQGPVSRDRQGRQG